MKSLVKKVLLWDRISLKNKNRIKKFFGKKVISKVKQKPKAKKNHFNSLFNSFSVVNADFSYYEVALYFAGGMGNIYQVEQWIGSLNSLNKKKRLTLIVREKAVFTWLAKNTDFTVVYCLTISDLTNFYEENNIKCILYVNNGFKNFQSLIVEDALHVHINHGESDKSSTATNQANAYNYVFIVSDAGYDKYKANLIKVDMDKFIKVGRPQLEHIVKIEPFDTTYIPHVEEDNHPEETVLLSEASKEIEVESTVVELLEEKEKKIILYAPTWEGTHDSMNFTSLNDYGLTLVNQILDDSSYYLVYKPHPNTGSRDSITKRINTTIKRVINEHHRGEVILDGDINSLYEHIDLAIFDNSAVAIDYLQVNKPMLMTDMFYRMDNRQNKPTIIKAARMLSLDAAKNITKILDEELEIDTMKIERNQIKEYFLGKYDYNKQESTKAFVEQIVKICDERDKLLDVLVKYNDNKKMLFDN